MCLLPSCCIVCKIFAFLSPSLVCALVYCLVYIVACRESKTGSDCSWCRTLVPCNRVQIPHLPYALSPKVYLVFLYYISWDSSRARRGPFATARGFNVITSSSRKNKSKQMWLLLHTCRDSNPVRPALNSTPLSHPGGFHCCRIRPRFHPQVRGLQRAAAVRGSHAAGCSLRSQPQMPPHRSVFWCGNHPAVRHNVGRRPRLLRGGAVPSQPWVSPVERGRHYHRFCRAGD
jgi:hypothetical protein